MSHISAPPTPCCDALIAGYGRWLWGRRAAILVLRLAAKPAARDDYLVDATKYSHLRQTKLLINLHRETSRSFEWVRVLQAIVNGCVVVSEPSRDHAPLVPGEHFVVAAPESIPHVIEGLLEDPERLGAIRAAAYEMVRSELSMRSAAERLAMAAEGLAAGGAAGAVGSASAVLEPAPVDYRPAPPSDVAVIRNAVRNLSTDVLALRRAVDQLTERDAGREPAGEPEFVACTPSFREARPTVSVIVAVHNYEREVVHALASVDNSQFDEHEVLILDDASSDGSLDAVLGFLHDRPWMPAALLRHRVNRDPRPHATRWRGGPR